MTHPTRIPVLLAPGAGRAWPMGRIAAIFKADGDETRNSYSISEWWLEPHTTGACARRRGLRVLRDRGTMSVLLGETWHDAPQGSFALAPAGTRHDFENRSDARAGVLNFSMPGGFEQHTPSIAEWYAEHPPGAARAGQSDTPVRPPT